MEPDELGTRLFRAFEQGDLASLDNLLADDARLWNPFIERTKGELFAALPPDGVIVPELRYDQIRRRVFADGSGFVQQHVARGRGPGGPMALPACVVVDIQGDQVKGVSMYYDSAPVRQVGLG
jgi:ketosteroid isomerase-like protein